MRIYIVLLSFFRRTSSDHHGDIHRSAGMLHRNEQKMQCQLISIIAIIYMNMASPDKAQVDGGLFKVQMSPSWWCITFSHNRSRARRTCVPPDRSSVISRAGTRWLYFHHPGIAHSRIKQSHNIAPVVHDDMFPLQVRIHYIETQAGRTNIQREARLKVACHHHLYVWKTLAGEYWETA